MQDLNTHVNIVLKENGKGEKFLVYQLFALSKFLLLSSVSLTLKRLGGRGGNLTPPYGFSKNVSSFFKKVKPWFFVTFNIIINHIFPENFTEIAQVVKI